MDKIFVLVLLLGQQPGPEWWPVIECQVHDLDTWSNAKIEIPHIKQWLVDKDIRLSGVDAVEITYARQAVLARNPNNILINEGEIKKAKLGLSEFMKIKGKKYIRIKQFEATYNRIEADMLIVTETGALIDVKKWIVDNKYERPIR